MKMLKTLILRLTTSLKRWGFKNRRRFKTLAIEERAVKLLPPHKREEAIIALRFGAWVQHFDIAADKVQRRKMLLAFRAGFNARELE
jgi:hypothetical protein